MRLISRLAGMDRAELNWRGAAAARIAFDRARARITPPQWDRDDLHTAVTPLPGLAEARAALAARRWDDAQRKLAAHFVEAPRRFAIGAAMKRSVADAIRRDFPDSAHDAIVRADRILSGEYNLLAFRGLRFSDPAHSANPAPSTLPDWQYDPVHDRRPPQSFWSTVPYLDPSSGDHKIIWELNRHQHWLSLGRAYWLTGDPKYRARAIEELASWMRSNPPLTGINWASMLELGLRSLSWIWALQFFVDADSDDSPWIVDLLLGLDRQLAQVERNLSYYFSPNTHLLGEALALYVAGRALPELAAGERRAAIGRRILVSEIVRQIADDGGHCERSAHYHRYALDFYLLALAIARITADPAAADFERAADRLASAARLLADDSGRLPHIGDDDGGALLPIVERDCDDARGSLAIAAAMLNRPDLQVGEAPEEVWWIVPDTRRKRRDGARGSSQASGALPQTGYYVSRSSAGDHLVIDAGPHGYQNGGHAHADALSLTFVCRGVPLLIDPGTASYTTDAELRDRMRSSAMHNTLTIDGRSQSIPDGPFHWGRTADARGKRWTVDRAYDYFDGAHNGYAPMEHRRRVLARHGDLLVVADFVDGVGRHRAAAHWHVDPRWTADVRGRSVELSDGDRRIDLAVPAGIIDAFIGDAATGLGWYSPAYGRLDKTTTVRVTHEGNAPFWIATVFGLDAANPIAEVEWIADATLRITRARSTDEIVFTETDPLFRRIEDQGRTKDQICAASLAS